MATISFFFILFLSWLFPEVIGYDGTTSFDSVLIAHPSPTICPESVNGLFSWLPDPNYIACCDNWAGTQTLTTGLGPGSKPVYACCRSGYTCTAPVSLMKDWSIDSNGDLQTRDLPNPPTPTAAPGAGITTIPAEPSTGTFSGPGATPLTTSAGVIVYVSNENNNENGGDNINIDSNNSDGSSGASSPGAIAGITVACTVVSTIAAVLGVWYARKRKREKESASI